MSKKALRKELEIILIKTIEGILHIHNPEAAKKIKKVIDDSSGTIAKKFYKAAKASKSSKINTPKKSVKKPVKSAVTKVKAKAKK